MGTKVQALVIKVTNTNRLGDEDTAIKEKKEIQVHIKYPSGKTVMFRNRDSDGNLIEDKAIFLEDILPIELFVPLETADTVENGDILIHCLVDENDNIIPQVFQIASGHGSFNGKDLVAKSFIINNIRDTLNADIRKAIKDFILVEISDNSETNS